MKIVIETLLLTIAIFLPNFVESRPGSEEGNMNFNNNNNAARGIGKGKRRVTMQGPGGLGFIHADFSQQATLPPMPPTAQAVDPHNKIYRGQGLPLFNYEKNGKGFTTGINHVILPHTAPGAPGGEHTVVDYSYQAHIPPPAPWHPNPGPHNIP